MSRKYSMKLAGRTLTAEIGKVAEQANGAVLLSYGETVVLTAVTASEKPREGIDFFPLSVDYEEKMYSIGKIPGGFIKREGKPSENSVLTSRVIDRPIRPLFPKDYRNDVSVVNTVLCVDQDCSPELVAMIGTSIALSISDIPFAGPTGSSFIGYVDDELVINPTAAERGKSRLQLTVASTKDKVCMIEAGADEIPEDLMLKAIFMGDEQNKEVVTFIDGIVAKEGKSKHDYEKHEIPKELYTKVTEFITNAAMEKAVFTDNKQKRQNQIGELKEKVVANFAEDEEILSCLSDIMYKFEKATVRKMILKDHKRPDGRKLNELRKLTSEVDILPRTHGTGLFSRGQTQVLTIATLAGLRETQHIDGLDELVVGKRYMHHYNFPSYSVGETRPSRGPGRREIGHGALAERALVPVLPSEEEFPYAIRLVSEILSSNGSTSQGSICASTLALMAAGVPIKAPVAGISAGLVTGETDDDFVILTDIQGLEDFFGDMDFKVAGTHKGITAIQMDMKIPGLTNEVIRQAIADTKKSRTYILDEVMLKAIDKPREEISKYAPKIVQIKINPEKISEVIGQRGKTINKIIEDTGVKIDIDDDGKVSICGEDTENVKKAIKTIENIILEIEVDQIYNAKVMRVAAFGAFVQLVPGKEALLHVSKISHEHIKNVEDVVSIGDEMLVKVIEVDRQGRIRVSRKDLIPKPEDIKK